MQKRNIAMIFTAGQDHPCYPLSTICAISACLLWGLFSADRAFGQSEEVALMEQVETLVDQLNSAAIADRDTAQDELVTLTPDALDYIDVPDEDATTDFIERLLQVRKTLEAKAVEQTTRPTTVSLEGEFSVEQALKKISQSTGNNIALREGVPLDLAQQQITLSLKSVPFWDAIHSVMQQSDLEVDVYGGTAGSIVLVPIPTNPSIPNDAPAENDGQANASKRLSPPRTTSGVLALEINRVDTSRILNARGLDYTTLNMLIRWEPRLQPISIELAQATLKIIDDHGNTIAPLRQTPLSAPVQSEIPELIFPVNVPLIDRKVNSIKTITGTLDAVLPGRTETFRFRGLDDVANGTSQTKSGATVTFGGIQINEQLFGVNVGLSFDDQSNELDSHQGWAFDNEAYLVDPQNPQTRHEAVALETVVQNGQQVVVDYYFEVDPKSFDLVYQTPAAIVSVSFDFELKDIPLP